MKNPDKKVPNRVEPVVFPNPLYESMKPKMVLREL